MFGSEKKLSQIADGEPFELLVKLKGELLKKENELAEKGYVDREILVLLNKLGKEIQVRREGLVEKNELNPRVMGLVKDIERKIKEIDAKMQKKPLGELQKKMRAKREEKPAEEKEPVAKPKPQIPALPEAATAPGKWRALPKQRPLPAQPGQPPEMKPQPTLPRQPAPKPEIEGKPELKPPILEYRKMQAPQLEKPQPEERISPEEELAQEESLRKALERRMDALSKLQEEKKPSAPLTEEPVPIPETPAKPEPFAQPEPIPAPREQYPAATPPTAPREAPSAEPMPFETLTKQAGEAGEKIPEFERPEKEPESFWPRAEEQETIPQEQGKPIAEETFWEEEKPAVPVPEPEPEPLPEQVPTAEPVPKPALEPEPQPAPETAAEPEPRPEPESELHEEPARKLEPELQPQAESFWETPAPTEPRVEESLAGIPPKERQETPQAGQESTEEPEEPLQLFGPSLRMEKEQAEARASLAPSAPKERVKVPVAPPQREEPIPEMLPVQKEEKPSFGREEGAVAAGFGKTAPAPSQTPATGAMAGALDVSSAEELYASSVSLLKKLQIENGACLATNLDERIPYIYPRDHAFATLAFVSAGMRERAARALEFALGGQKKDGSFPQRWYKEGSDASYKPSRIDSCALIVLSFAEYVKRFRDIPFAQRHWDSIERAIEFIDFKISPEKKLVFAEASVHEFPPLERGYEIWANAACYAALKNAAQIGEVLKVRVNALDKHHTLKEGILFQLWNSRSASFVKCIKTGETLSVFTKPDASLLAVSFFDLLKPENERVKGTVERVENALQHKELGGITPLRRENNFLGSAYGSSPFFTLLLADAFIKQGNREKAEKYLAWASENSFGKKLAETVAVQQDFEQFISDLTDAGLLSKERMRQAEYVKAHPLFRQGIARITEPFSLPHALFVIVWNEFKNSFSG